MFFIMYFLIYIFLVILMLGIRVCMFLNRIIIFENVDCMNLILSDIYFSVNYCGFIFCFSVFNLLDRDV